MSIFQSVVTFFNDGGATMYITATAGVAAVVIAVERGLYLYRDTSMNSPVFMSRIKEFLLQNRVQDAVHFCHTQKKAPLPNVVKAGLERMGCDENIVRQSMESVYLDQVPKVTDRLGYLSLIANAGMLFGLLGTVLGLIAQFAALASADAADKQIMMAKGIAHAMNNTALGLMVALPALIIHGIYTAKASRILEELERASAQFLDWVGLYNYGELQERLTTKSRPQLKTISNGKAETVEEDDSTERKAA